MIINEQSTPLLDRIYSDIETHIEIGDSNPDWRDRLRELYEQFIRYFAENPTLLINNPRLISGGREFPGEFDPVRYMAFDIRTMLDLYFEALDEDDY